MKKCKFCFTSISPNENGNRMYCDSLCYTMSKLKRQQQQREHLTEKKDQLKVAEKLLSMICYQYGSSRPIDPKVLESYGFDFSLTERNIIKNGKLGTQIGQFAYVFNNEREIIIWKI